MTEVSVRYGSQLVRHVSDLRVLLTGFEAGEVEDPAIRSGRQVDPLCCWVDSRAKNSPKSIAASTQPCFPASNAPLGQRCTLVGIVAV